MSGFLKKNWIHLVVWAAMIFYIAFSPSLYSHLILNHGKPVEFIQELPKTSKKLNYSVDRMDRVLLNGQDYYSLIGWAYYEKDADRTRYEIFIVLKSPSRTYYFPTQSIKRTNLQKGTKLLKIDLTNYGFSSDLSTYTIEPDEYKIGILYKNKSTGESIFSFTKGLINSTLNKAELNFE